VASQALLAVLTYGHVLSAMGWLGGGILTAFVLGPSLRAMPPAAILEFNAKVLPRILRFVQIVIGTTFLFGLLLLYFDYEGNFTFLSKTSQGMELSFGILLAVVTAIIAWTVTLPAFKRVSQISNGLLQSDQQPPPPDLAKYGARARRGAMLGVGLLLIVLAMMVASGFALF